MCGLLPTHVGLGRCSAEEQVIRVGQMMCYNEVETGMESTNKATIYPPQPSYNQQTHREPHERKQGVRYSDGDTIYPVSELRSGNFRSILVFCVSEWSGSIKLTRITAPQAMIHARRTVVGTLEKMVNRMLNRWRILYCLSPSAFVLLSS